MTTNNNKPLRLLVLGGTGLIGPHQVRYALSRGHQVTIFNRGRTKPGIFGDQVEQLLGDRKNNLESIKAEIAKGRTWDAVLDNPATLPQWVRDAAELLKPASQRYLFVSTVSVYADNTKINQDESGPLMTTTEPNATKITGENYGALKALAEEEARKAFGKNAIIVRPGLIVGPGDDTRRFLYWPLRLRKGGEILAPGNGKDPVQYIDARDLAEWSVRLVERENTGGTYNAIGPAKMQTMGNLMGAMQKAVSKSSKIIWVPTEFVLENKISPWGDMPLWIPGEGERAGFHRRQNQRALRQGLTFRSPADIAKGCLEWFDGLSPEEQKAAQGGLSYEREKEVLALWKAAGAKKS
jgi:2'-hydroxyisoflavone reductase